MFGFPSSSTKLDKIIAGGPQGISIIENHKIGSSDKSFFLARKYIEAMEILDIGIAF